MGADNKIVEVFHRLRLRDLVYTANRFLPSSGATAGAKAAGMTVILTEGSLPPITPTLLP